MTPTAFRALFAAAAGACLFATVPYAQTPAKPAAKAAPATRAAPATGPWAKVPPLTTTCYSGTDGFNDKLEAARSALSSEVEAQQATNEQIQEQFNDIDPMEKAQRMQQWMMSNPQEAARMMGAQQQLGQQAQAENPQLTSQALKFDAERESLRTGYQAALEQALAPSSAKYAALEKKLEAAGCNFEAIGCAVPPAIYAERDVIFREMDAAYQATCATYWTATGKMAEYSGRYRSWLADKWLAHSAAADDVKRAQYAIMDTPAAAWKSPVPAQTVNRYLREIGELYALRKAAPICTVQACPR
jgi:hypothetical protein